MASFLGKLKGSIRRYFFTGLIVLVPVAVTFFTVKWIILNTDKILRILPDKWNPALYMPITVPGIGLVISFLFILLIGMLTTSIVGKKLVDLYEKALSRIPFISSLYGGAKELVATIFQDKSSRFNKVILIEYPRKGIYSLALVTGDAWKKFKEIIGDDDLIDIFVPTTPNPTSGFFLMVPKKEIIPLDINVEDAFRLIISAGMLEPEEKKSLPTKKINKDFEK
ncbi:MAG: DUF502 domain-containing protein [Spirochaetes bacterium]|nr:DUF502 domain-containing protein [Deltaproteobacteria bacterium]RKY03592.1 MAG: DUF502 domain-containing protein [Spirochaetota bacterium]RLA91394.1 MAG: DUF502 domain-containing protein [Deltaproteobacteria bacterium]